ncbi:MAG: flagellar hook-basal body complex protein FliE [Litoreibacter sp.]
MDISTSLAARAYDLAKDGVKPSPNSNGGLIDGAQAFAKVLQQGETTAQASMVGNVDPHALVEALTQTELAVEAAVAVRNKVVEAYQEILRMPV